MKVFFYKKFMPIILSFSIVVITFSAYSIPVYAVDFMPTDIVAAIEYGIENNDWQPFYRFLYESSDGLMYMISQMGAVVNRDFITWVDNNKKLESLANTVPARKEDNNITFTKEFMTQLKALLDEYAKEHEPYYMVNTLTLDDFLGNTYTGSKLMYDTAKNLLEDSPSGVIAFGAYYSHPTEMYFVDIGNDFKNVSPVKYYPYSDSYVTFYNNDTWGQSTYTMYYTMLDMDGEAIKTAAEFKEKATRTENWGTNFEHPISYIYCVYPFGVSKLSYPYDCRGATNRLSLVTKEPRRIRVFNTYGDFQNYTLGKRSVYYTSKYYEYVPEDLTVSIDDLQKTVDDLQKVIDELVKRITDRTDESEIEELLRQILEALKNQQGTGSGSQGVGNVTVNVDMATTNSWLSKIYSKVSQIFDKMNSAVEEAENTALDKIQESLDEIIVQLKKIKGWTIADTLVDAADAVADWADFIKDLLLDADSGVAAISSAMDGSANLLKTKFPFCIPWDVYFLISFLAHEPVTPEFKLPIKIERLGIDEYIEVDMSQFAVVSDISRTLLTLIYCYALLNLTLKIFPMTKEET